MLGVVPQHWLRYLEGMEAIKKYSACMEHAFQVSNIIVTTVLTAKLRNRSQIAASDGLCVRDEQTQKESAEPA
jgi:hypothetical protein